MVFCSVAGVAVGKTLYWLAFYCDSNTTVAVLS
jgi:hypothetical protein